jgi:hypothetical protein
MMPIPILLILGLAAAAPTAGDTPFPERTPGMIEACLIGAISDGEVSKEADRYKYVCAGDPANQLWQFLESAQVESWEQTVDGGVWRSRGFPLGGCFKRVRNEDGSEAPNGLSCTIWIPRKR